MLMLKVVQTADPLCRHKWPTPDQYKRFSYLVRPIHFQSEYSWFIICILNYPSKEDYIRSIVTTVKCNYHSYMDINYGTKVDTYNRWRKLSTTYIPLVRSGTEGCLFRLILFLHSHVWLLLSLNCCFLKLYISFCLSFPVWISYLHHCVHAWLKCLYWYYQCHYYHRT